MTTYHKNGSRSLALALCMLSAVSCTSINVSKDTTERSPQTVADAIIRWWPGDYNNDAQIAALKADGAPIWKQGQDEDGQMFGGHLPVTSYYRTVDMPAFGDRVLYLEEFTFKKAPYRQRIYTVSVDEADRVRVKLWNFKNKTTHAGAWKDVSRITDLKPEDMSPLPDKCDLVVIPSKDGRLQMMMPRDQCKFGTTIYDYRVSLSAEDFWFRDRIVDAETMEITVTAGSFTYHKLDKISAGR